ncbi:MAG: hypothetical protein LBF00_02985 [Mycoplasmataceae bacterium]|jgi:flagellar biosynthesis/type III secretory pathway M-ring protein FliF/YscJ|nr:hypothetical protein [Mycoplasmataceae bacterium]
MLPIFWYIIIGICAIIGLVILIYILWRVIRRAKEKATKEKDAFEYQALLDKYRNYSYEHLRHLITSFGFHSIESKAIRQIIQERIEKEHQS